MDTLKEDVEKEDSLLGITIEYAQPFPLIHLIGHAPISTQKLFEFIEYLERLGQQRGDFFDSAPETWWGKLSDQGKQNAKDLFSVIWQGYNHSKNAVKQPIISAHCLEISPAFLKGGWYSDSEAEQILWLISLVFAGLFDHMGLTTSDIIELLFKGFQSFVNFGKQLQDQLRADLNLLQAFADVLVGRAATHADALSNLYWVGKSNDALDVLDEVFTEILQKSVRNVLVSPSLDPPYPMGVLRLHTLAHQFMDQRKETKKVVDEQLTEFIRVLLEKATSSRYFEQPPSKIDMVIARNPSKALLLDLLLESRETGRPVAELAKELPGEFDSTELSKQTSQARRQLQSIYQQEDPRLTFLRKIGRL